MKIKVAFFVFLFIIQCSISIFGQGKSDITIFGISQRTWIQNKSDYKYPGIVVPKPTYNYACGVLLSTRLKKRLRLETGLLYSNQNQGYDSNSKGAETKVKINLSYIKVPFNVRYNFIDRNNFCYYISAGPQLAFLVLEDGGLPVFEDAKLVNGTYYATVFDVKEVGGGYRQLIVEVNAGMGIDLRLLKNVYATLQLRFDRSIMDVEDKDYTIVQDYGSAKVYEMFSFKRAPSYNMTLGLLTGVSFKFN